MTLCECGCGQHIKDGDWETLKNGRRYFHKRKRRFLWGHFLRANRKLISDAMKKRHRLRSQTGMDNPMFGKTPWNRGKKVGICWNKGKKCPQLTGPKNGQYGKPSRLRGKKLPMETKMKMSKWRANFVLPIKDTTIENIIQNELKIRGIEFTPHKPFNIHGMYHQVDIFIRPNICIECDGDYWHSLPEAAERDAIIDIGLKKDGYRVLRLWEHDIKNKLDECMIRICKCL